MQSFSRRTFLAAAALLAAGCQTAGQRRPSAADGSPDRSNLQGLMDEAAERRLGVHGLLVMHCGALIFEQYAAGVTASEQPHLYSCTKSVVSLLTGIALAQDLLPGVEARVLDLLPDRAARLADNDPRKQEITLHHLLSMSAGFDWPEWTPWSARHPIVQMERSPDWAQYVLDRPMASEPGREWHYNTGGAHLAAVIVQAAVRQPLRAFAVDHLFSPLGIHDFTWPVDPQGVNIGGYGLHMTARDLAKIGLLCLREGRWENRQLVPAAWLEASTQRYFTADPPDRGYGYMWWLPQFGGYAATGYGGHRLYVLPERDLVIVLTAAMSERDMTLVPEELISRWVLGR